jgi:hypothetical protein
MRSRPTCGLPAGTRRSASSSRWSTSSGSSLRTGGRSRPSSRGRSRSEARVRRSRSGGGGADPRAGARRLLDRGLRGLRCARGRRAREGSPTRSTPSTSRSSSPGPRTRVRTRRRRARALALASGCSACSGPMLGNPTSRSRRLPLRSPARSSRCRPRRDAEREAARDPRRALPPAAPRAGVAPGRSTWRWRHLPRVASFVSRGERVRLALPAFPRSRRNRRRCSGSAPTWRAARARGARAGAEGDRDGIRPAPSSSSARTAASSRTLVGVSDADVAKPPRRSEGDDRRARHRSGCASSGSRTRSPSCDHRRHASR